MAAGDGLPYERITHGSRGGLWPGTAALTYIPHHRSHIAIISLRGNYMKE